MAATRLDPKAFEFPMGEVGSLWVAERELEACLVDSAGRSPERVVIPAGGRLRYLGISWSLYSPCFGYDWTMHDWDLLDPNGTTRRVRIETACLAPVGGVTPA